jgi:hypothetical protein
MDALHAYIKSSLSSFAELWSNHGVASHSISTPPDSIFMQSGAVLKNDIKLQWLSWFCEALCVPDPKHRDLHSIYSLVKLGLKHLGFDESHESFDDISYAISSVLRDKIRHSDRKRLNVTRAIKEDLLNGAGSQPRCWICNAEFTKEAITTFLGGRARSPLPSLVDYMMPRGLVDRDYAIEIEHKIPFSKGGGDLDDPKNIALSCGWCNRHKWNYMSIYDVGSNGGLYKHNIHGLLSVPEPYWVIRKIGLAQKCSETGCREDRKSDLFIDLINPHGAANPINLRVVCKNHLQDSAKRLVDAGSYKSKLEKKGVVIL